VAPGADRWAIRDSDRQSSLNAFAASHEFEFKVDLVVDITGEAARLRAAAEAKPMRLPVNRKVDESHHTVTADGLSVWYTIQVSPHSRIQEVVFERADHMPSEEECRPWLDALIIGAEAAEAPSFPGAMTRRFEAFERNPDAEAPIA
jgi:hypothetical protein